MRLPSPLVEIYDERVESRGVRLYLKRDDLIHADLPGNKWRKLKYNLDAARKQGVSTLLTFGGAYSNHIRATAAAGHYFGFNTIGVIRDEEHIPLNGPLAYAKSHGQQPRYCGRPQGREGVAATIVVFARQGTVLVSISPPFTWEAIMDPEQVDELIRTLGLAQDDATKMSSSRESPVVRGTKLGGSRGKDGDGGPDADVDTVAVDERDGTVDGDRVVAVVEVGAVGGSLVEDRPGTVGLGE